MVVFRKIKNRLWSEAVQITRHSFIYHYIYKSYWHFLFNRHTVDGSAIEMYFSATPNRGAGIGHQMANWIAGYWFARQFNLIFAHIPFSEQQWEKFLGFGEGEKTVAKLVEGGYKRVQLPLFNESSEAEMELIRRIIASYRGKKVVFVCEQDQFYKNQFGVMGDLKRKFYGAEARKNDNLLYNPSKFNIAIHIRRGDIVQSNKTKENPNLTMRWIDNDYFINTLKQTIEELKTDKEMKIYLFSQGVMADFAEFAPFDIIYCLDMSAQNSFLHMVYADLLITSKSSFSYKPALISNGIKVCPKDFWHGYPDDDDFILI